jgi:hypothetical protein
MAFWWIAARERWLERMDIYRAQGAEIEEPDWDALRQGRDVNREEAEEFARFKAEYEASKAAGASDPRFSIGKPGDGGTCYEPGPGE